MKSPLSQSNTNPRPTALEVAQSFYSDNATFSGWLGLVSPDGIEHHYFYLTEGEITQIPREAGERVCPPISTDEIAANVQTGHWTVVYLDDSSAPNVEQIASLLRLQFRAGENRHKTPGGLIRAAQRSAAFDDRIATALLNIRGGR